MKMPVYFFSFEPIDGISAMNWTSASSFVASSGTGGSKSGLLSWDATDLC